MVKMHALILNRYNGPLELSEVPRPKPLTGQVLVRIAASGFNPLDTKIRSGSAAHAKHPVPLVLGIDLAGVVEEVGPGVTAFKVSDEVYGMTGGVGGIQGSLAQYAAVDDGFARFEAFEPDDEGSRRATARRHHLVLGNRGSCASQGWPDCAGPGRRGRSRQGKITKCDAGS